MEVKKQSRTPMMKKSNENSPRSSPTFQRMNEKKPSHFQLVNSLKDVLQKYIKEPMPKNLANPISLTRHKR